MRFCPNTKKAKSQSEPALSFAYRIVDLRSFKQAKSLPRGSRQGNHYISKGMKRVAKPKKLKKPHTSVAVVRKTVDTKAGSPRNFLTAKGMK